MSATEGTSIRTRCGCIGCPMIFDMDSKLTQEARAVVLQVLASMAESPLAMEHKPVHDRISRRLKRPPSEAVGLRARTAQAGYSNRKL